MISSYRTYYVNCKTGSDTNDGMSMDSPFASLFPINTLTLNPGDTVSQRFYFYRAVSAD